MIQSVIIDDEISNIENLSILLSKYCTKITVAGTATNVDQALVLIQEINPSIIFLDIQMPGKTGFDLLKSLVSPNFEVIFVTAYHEYAIQAIRFSAIDYLLKPININDLINAVNRAILNLEKKDQTDRLENLIRSLSNKSHLRIAVTGNKETVFVNPETILYCKANNNYTTLFLQNNDKVLSSKPIFEYEELLGGLGFIRCHQSFLVNTALVKRWTKTDGDRLIMINEDEVPISRNSKEKVKQAIGAR
jgi:two-component system, LytTR family, response regulator